MAGLWFYCQSGVTELLIMRDPYHDWMCFKSVKTLYILRRGKGRGQRPRPFPQLRMYRSSGFNLYGVVNFFYFFYLAFDQYIYIFKNRYKKYTHYIIKIVYTTLVVLRYNRLIEASASLAATIFIFIYVQKV